MRCIRRLKASGLSGGRRCPAHLGRTSDLRREGADGDTLENESRSSQPSPPAGRESPDRGVTTDLGSDETARRVRVRDEGGSDERRRVPVAALLQRGHGPLKRLPFLEDRSFTSVNGVTPLWFVM